MGRFGLSRESFWAANEGHLGSMFLDAGRWVAAYCVSVDPPAKVPLELGVDMAHLFEWKHTAAS